MDKELRQLLEDVLKEFKDLAVVLKGSNKIIRDGTRSKKDEMNLKKVEMNLIKAAIKKREEAGESFDDLPGSRKVQG